MIPLFLSYLFSEFPELSYVTAWIGSFWIFLLVFSGFVKPIPGDLSLFEQAMRPIVLTHIIFAGYMACSSIFYFLDATGYYYFDKDPFAILDTQNIIYIAQCQRYYLLGHTFFVFGILIFMNYNFVPKYKILVNNISGFTLKLTFFFSGLAFAMHYVPGLGQLEVVSVQVSMVCSVISLSYALPEKIFVPIITSGFLFLFNYIRAVSSGWKEAIIVPLILLGVYLYPSYKKVVIFTAPIVLGAFFYLVPTFNGIVRNLSWSGEVSGTEAAQIAFEHISSGEEDLSDGNWRFLVGRISEIGMFIDFVKSVESTPEPSFLGFKIINQSLESLIPRIFYPSKPITESLVMERVYNAGVINENSTVSAKPPPIVDGYLSAGFWGVLFTCFFMGSFASWISVTAEKIFGSYLIGSGLIYTGLFQVLWRGNCFEFMINNLFWGMIIMFILFNVARIFKIIERVDEFDF